MMSTEERNRFIAAKLNEGLSLSDVQKLLVEQGVNMTYLDLRMLASELEVNWQKQAVARPARPVADLSDLSDGSDDQVGAQTAVTVDKVVRPGAAMSGSVKFASGASAEWYLDQYGRLGLSPRKGSAKPSEDDIREFQVELQRKLTGG